MTRPLWSALVNLLLLVRESGTVHRRVYVPPKGRPKAPNQTVADKGGAGREAGPQQMQLEAVPQDAQALPAPAEAKASPEEASRALAAVTA